MSMTLNLHRPAAIKIDNMMVDHVGKVVVFKLADDDGNIVTAFFTDETLPMIAAALAKYAADTAPRLEQAA